MKKIMITIALLVGLQATPTYAFLDEAFDSAIKGINHGIQYGISDGIRTPLKQWSQSFANDYYKTSTVNREHVAIGIGLALIGLLAYSYYKKRSQEACLNKKKTRFVRAL